MTTLLHASPPPPSTHTMIPHNLFSLPPTSAPTQPPKPTQPQPDPQTPQKRKRQTDVKPFRNAKRTKPTPLIKTLVKSRLGCKSKKIHVETLSDLSSVAPAEGGPPIPLPLPVPVPTMDDPSNSDPPQPLLVRSDTTLEGSPPFSPPTHPSIISSPQTHLKSQRKVLLKSLTQTVQTLSKSLKQPKPHLRKAQRRDVLVRRKRMLEWVRRVDT
ncbi:hypothetical protein SpCBS45565_g04426 [Spizellomyces sp. 'palustris']|nr:hypothetical protein SpCBS45565_g04426 [Spizellomyces sp. 'palustris']